MIAGYCIFFVFCVCANSLQELEDFITEADKGLLTPVQEGDYEGLLRVMGFLYHVRERQVTTDEMFEPIKEIINMLKIYDVEFSEETYLKLQVISFNHTHQESVSCNILCQPL
jgi:dynein heavy chain